MASPTLTLCYHAISSSWPAALAVTAASFAEQMSLLSRRGLGSLNFTRAASESARGSVCITFDDAFESVYTEALPILDALDLTGTVFVPTDYPNAPPPMSWPGTRRWEQTSHVDELKSMSWDQIGDLIERGWEIGSHTGSHPRLTELGDAEALAELKRSKETIEDRVGRPCTSFAYPYGAWDARIEPLVKRAGYEAAATLPARFKRPWTQWSYPRVGVYRRDTPKRFAMKTSRTTNLIRSTSAWALVDRVKPAPHGASDS